MKKYSNRILAAISIAALLLAALALPVATGSAVARGAGATISANENGPFAAYTKKRVKRARKVVRRSRSGRAVQVAVAPAAAYVPAPVVAAPALTAPAAPVDEATLARTLLDGYKAQYPRYLGGATVEFGDAQGYQAISYFTAGRIVISPSHTASVERIMAHEIWHIIDWQDNGRIDWGESIPPVNAATYAN